MRAGVVVKDNEKKKKKKEEFKQLFQASISRWEKQTACGSILE